MLARKCAECGQEFQYKASQPGRECCSMSCAARRRNRRLEAEGRLHRPVKPRRGETNPCAVCGKPVYRNSGQAAKGVGVFCSPACRQAGQTRDAVVKSCARCGTEMRLKPSQAGRVYCSRACMASGATRRPLDRVHNGRSARKDAQGYVMVYEPSHPNTSQKGWQYEHRLVAEAALGRYLTSTEHVHHVNHVRDDNRPENLEVMDGDEHAALSGLEYRDQLNRDRAELAEYRRRFGPLPEED